MDSNDPNTNLYDVVALSPTNAWAVGAYGDPQGRFVIARILHWDGISWSVFPSPTGGSYAFLYSVSAVSATDIWAVGLWSDRQGAPHPFALYYDGIGWNRIHTVSPTMADVFQGVQAIAPNDIWAVGYQEPVAFQFQPLTEHWDGTSWQVVPAPSINGDSNFLYDVSGTASDDVWAVGPLGGTGTPPLTMHWDGATWSVVPAAYGQNRSFALLAVKAISANDVWAVGQWVTLDLLDEGLAAEHWDGSTWTITRMPSPPNGGTFYGIGASSSTDIWAVGYFYDASFDGHPLAQHSKGPCIPQMLRVSPTQPRVVDLL